MAAMAASGLFGDIARCAGIVGNVDLRLGDADRNILGDLGVPHWMLDPKFRVGFRHLQPLGLGCEAWQLEYQLPELIDLARAFPITQIIVNHTGGLCAVRRYSGRTEERFAQWRENIRSLSLRPNVSMKLGGLGMPTCGFRSSLSPRCIKHSAA
jgi:predicted TIM-barrel fold metal-dependent hydrolase